MDYYLGIALGELDMGVEEFWEMRLKDFFLKLHFFNIRKRQKIETYSDLVRMQTVALINIQLEKKSRITDPKKFWLFPWEVEENDKPDDGPDIGNVLKLSRLL